VPQEDLRAAQAREGGKLVREARLSDPRLADDHHGRPLAGQNTRQRRAQLLLLALAPDEGISRFQEIADLGLLDRFGQSAGFAQSPQLRGE
jgi:hypothetical protein